MTVGASRKDQARDLEADLAYCQAADDIAPFVALDHKQAYGFILNALEGWPYAIRRAMESENEVDKLRRELENLQDQMNRPRGCYD